MGAIVITLGRVLPDEVGVPIVPKGKMSRYGFESSLAEIVVSKPDVSLIVRVPSK